MKSFYKNLSKSFSGFSKNFNTYLYSLNDSKYFAGFIMILLNLSSKFITIKFTNSQESYLRYMFTKQLLIFSIAWMGTRDIYIAITITAAFVILADYAFNENSKFCIMPETYKKVTNAMDLNNDGILTDDEINKSIKILEKARKVQNFKLQEKSSEQFHNMKKY